MSSTLKMQSIKFTSAGGRNVHDSIEFREEQRNSRVEERDSDSTVNSPTGRPVGLFGGIPFNEAVSNSDYMQFNP